MSLPVVEGPQALLAVLLISPHRQQPSDFRSLGAKAVAVKPLRFVTSTLITSVSTATTAHCSIIWIQFNKLLADVEDHDRLRSHIRGLLSHANMNHLTFVMVVESHRQKAVRLLRGCSIYSSTFSWCTSGQPLSGYYEVLSNLELPNLPCRCSPDVEHVRCTDKRHAHHAARTASTTLTKMVLDFHKQRPLPGSGQALLVPDSDWSTPEPFGLGGGDILSGASGGQSFPLAGPLASESSKAFPTESRERQKEKERWQKETGEVVEVKKKQKYVEQHYDDCGMDLKSIESLLAAELPWDGDGDVLYEDPSEVDGFADGLLQFALLGQGHPGMGMPPTATYMAASVLDMMSVLASAGPGQDLLEVNGDSVALRSFHPNDPSLIFFDSITTTDFTEPSEREAVRLLVASGSVF